VELKVHIPARDFSLQIFTPLCFAILCTIALSAQQVTPPADLANSWEKSSAALITILSSRGHNYVLAWDPKLQYRISLEKNFDAPMRCDFVGQAFAFESLHGTAKAGVFTIDFTLVDPFSIRVGFDQPLGLWSTDMSGIRGMAISSWKGVLRSHIVLSDVKGTVKPSLLEPSCAAGEKHCKPDQGVSNSAPQLFDDQPAAEAFALAARHAAIACASDSSGNATGSVPN
jgi:hypothetical protein